MSSIPSISSSEWQDAIATTRELGGPCPVTTMPVSSFDDCEGRYRAALEGGQSSHVAFDSICAANDRLKQQWHQALLETPQAQRMASVRAIALRVETIHGKRGQTQQASRLLHLWAEKFDKPRFSSAEKETMFEGVQLLNLSELVGAPSRLYCSQGKPTDEQRKNFRERPQRLVHLLQALELDSPPLIHAVSDFHLDVARSRPLTTQLLDLSERAAAMLSERPARPAMSNKKVAGILRGQGSDNLFADSLLQFVVESIEKDELPVATQNT